MSTLPAILQEAAGEESRTDPDFVARWPDLVEEFAEEEIERMRSFGQVSASNTVAAFETGGTERGAPPVYLPFDFFPRVRSPRMRSFFVLAIRDGFRSARSAAAQQTREVAGLGAANKIFGQHEKGCR